MTGWEIDPDTAAPGRVHVYVDGTATAVVAGNPRGDIAAAYPLYGAGHGYDVTIPALPGYHGVCAYGINSAGPGGNTTLGCKYVRVTIP